MRCDAMRCDTLSVDFNYVFHYSFFSSFFVIFTNFCNFPLAFRTQTIYADLQHILLFFRELYFMLSCTEVSPLFCNFEFIRGCRERDSRGEILTRGCSYKENFFFLDQT